MLQPKAGSVAVALDVLGDKIKGILNVTIIYPESFPRFWNFLCAVINEVNLQIELIEPQEIPYQNYYDNEDAQACFQDWINGLWQQKDVIFSKIFQNK